MINEQKNKLAFTLAEVLITLLIIGVISSIVIPAIVQDSQNAELKSAGKRAYSSLSDAARLIRNDGGGTIAPGFTSVDDMKNNFAKYLSVAKVCAPGQYFGNCWNSVGAYCGDMTPCNSGIYQSTAWWTSSTAYSTMVLNNGSCVIFEWNSGYNGNCNGSDGAGVCGRIYIDVNCNKGPNTVNKDVFMLRVYQDAKIGPNWGTENLITFLK